MMLHVLSMNAYIHTYIHTYLNTHIPEDEHKNWHVASMNGAADAIEQQHNKDKHAGVRDASALAAAKNLRLQAAQLLQVCVCMYVCVCVCVECAMQALWLQRRT